MKGIAGLLGLAIATSACSTLPTSSVGLPRTLGERSSNFGYIPLDGLAVNQTWEGNSCQAWFPPDNGPVPSEAYKPLLEALPDLSVRFAVANFTTEGGLTFGPAKVTEKHQNYRAVLDYVNVDAISVEFWIRKLVEVAPGEIKVRPLQLPLLPNERVVGYEAQIIPSDRLGGADVTNAAFLRKEYRDQQFEQVAIPVYVGVGMRLSADILALKGGATLSSLGAIGAQAQADAITGTLTVQTLGINGKPVATALPLPSKLDQTTIENAILALGTSRAVLFAGGQNPEVTTTPRIVGLYSPIGSDPVLINAVYSELSRERPVWRHPCKAKPTPPIQPAAVGGKKKK